MFSFFNRKYRGPFYPGTWIKRTWITSALGGGELAASHPLPPKGKRCQYPLSRRLGGSQSQSEHFGEEKNVWSLLGIKLCFLDIVLYVPFKTYYL
jgi:hypothetical protein